MRMPIRFLWVRARLNRVVDGRHFNRTTPSEDIQRFSAQISSVAARLTRLAESAADPDDYARRLIERLAL